MKTRQLVKKRPVPLVADGAMPRSSCCSKRGQDLLRYDEAGKLTLKLLDISPAGDAGGLRTVRWNLLYAFVRHVGTSEGELSP